MKDRSNLVDVNLFSEDLCGARRHDQIRSLVLQPKWGIGSNRRSYFLRQITVIPGNGIIKFPELVHLLAMH